MDRYKHLNKIIISNYNNAVKIKNKIKLTNLINFHINILYLINHINTYLGFKLISVFLNMLVNFLFGYTLISSICILKYKYAY